MMPAGYEAYRERLRGRRLPLAFVDLALFDENARALARRARCKPIRLATKSVRCQALLRRVLAAEGWRGLLCYSVREAALLAAAGFDDVVVAYPAWQDDDLAAACEAVAAGRVLTVMADSREHVDRLGRFARERGVVLPVCLDVDMSSDLPGLRFGVFRSPLRAAAAVRELALQVAAQPHLRLDGLMGYEAQLAGVPDRFPGSWWKGPVVRALKRRSLAEVRERRAAAIAAVREAGLTLRFVNGGGTGSLETTAAEEGVTELTAGSGLYAPGLFDHYRGFRHHPALAFALEVTRLPRPGVFTCAGGGYVASGAAGPDRLPQPYLPAEARLLENEGAGEVQTPVAYDGPVPLALGDPILMRHAKAGELCERFPTLLLLGLDTAEEVKTYRGEGWSFF